mgnify:CR=1 FL=1
MVRRKTHEEFVKEVYDLVGDEYSVLGHYTRSSEKLEIQHNICGHKWFINPNNFLRGKRCPKCAKYKTTEIFRKEVAEVSNDRWEVLGEYVSCDTPIKVRCKTHNHTFINIPSNILRRKVCKYCNAEYLSKVQRKSEEVFKKELEKRHNGKIINLDKYVNTHTKIGFKCLECNTVFEAEPNAILRLSGCPTCAESKGEAIIRDYLNKNKIPFEAQKTFSDCKRDRLLPFDFYIPSHNTLIEYDGEQHFQPIEFFGGENAFKDQQERDVIKNEYAKSKGINLVRIPYWATKEQITRMLNKHFK